MSRIHLLAISFLLFSGLVSAGSKEFSVDKTEGFSPLQINFDASKINHAKKFVWSFGNGETLTTTSSNVLYSYKKVGSYTASLKYVVNASEKNPNYKDAGSVIITVKEKPNQAPMAFLSCTPNNLLVNCNALSSFDPEGQAIRFEFDYGDGTVETSTTGLTTHSYLSAGLYTVKLTVTDNLGASSTTTTQVQAVKPPNVLPTVKLACTSTMPQTMTCSAEGSSDADGTISSFQYSFDDGAAEFKSDATSVTHLFSTAGSHSITLKVIDNDGGQNSATTSVDLRLNTPPDFELYASTTNGVAPLAVNFEARNANDIDGTIESYEWTFSDGGVATTSSTSHTFNGVGIFTATLKVTDNLGASTSKTTSITSLEPLKTPPSAFFKYDQGENQGTYLTLHAAQMKTQFDIKRAYYTVDNSRTIEIPEYYANTLTTVEMGSYGPHTITITVIDIRDQVSTFTHNLNLKSDPGQIIPYVNFKPTQSAARTTFLNLNLSFTSDYGEEIDYFHIDYGDGKSEDTREYYTTHVYNVAGTYNVKVSAFTTTGTRNAIIRPVVVTNAEVPMVDPVAAFTYKIYSFAQNVSFYDERSGSPNGNIISYFWDFGDGETAHARDVVHFYNPGTYFVKLRVVDFAGNIATQVQHITISGAGDDLVANSWCENNYLTADCYAVALDKFNQINHVQFNWGDGQSSLGDLQDPSRGIYHSQHIYGNDGTYSVVMNIGTERGQFKSTSSQVTLINNAPMVGGVKCDLYGFEIYCYPQESSDPEGGALTFSFDFGDGNSLTGDQYGVGHNIYAKGGNYIVSMKATDPLGKSVTVKTSVNIVNLPPVVAGFKCDVFKMEVYCYPESAVDPEGKLVTTTFDFGDGTSESNTDGVGHHVYSDYGSYNVNLKVSDPNGGEAYANYTVNIQNFAPVAFINCNVNNLLVNCNAAGSFDPEGGALHYKFEFGDGQVEENDYGWVTHAYAQAGLVNVTLTVTDDAGASAQATIKLMPLTPPNQMPIAGFECNVDNVRTVYCYEVNSYDPDGSIVSRKFSFDDGGSDFFNPPEATRHQFETGGEHAVTYTVLDNDGGVGAVTKTVIVKENHNPVADFECSTPGPQRLSCYSTSTDLDQGDFTSNFDWEFGDGFAQTGLEGWFDHTYSVSSTYTIKLTVHDQFGGASSVEKNITTIENKAPYASIQCQPSNGSTYHCWPEYAKDDDGYVSKTYWLIDGKKIDGWDIIFDFTNGGDFPVTFTMTDDLGKQGIANTVIHIDKPIADFNCQEISTLHYKCDVANQNTSIVYAKFEVDDQKPIEGLSAEFVLNDFGSHKITLTEISANAQQSVFTKDLNITKIYLAPKASYNTVVETGLSATFDGGESTSQSRTVKNYYWDFGDGITINSSDAIVIHKYKDVGSYLVSLTVKDELGAINKYSENIYIFDAEVEDPGDFGNTTLLGVDSDGDGVRDDIQRWINFEAKDNLQLKNVLRKYAQNWQALYANLNSDETLTSLLTKRNQLQVCLDGTVNDSDTYSHFLKIMEFMNSYTELRNKAWDFIKVNQTGLPYSVQSDDLDEKLKACNGI